MAFDITPYIHQTPAQVRAAIRRGEIDFPTAGMCAGYAQANLVILPPEYAADFEEYTRLNPFPCPVLEIVKGSPITHAMGEGASLVTDIPRYRVYENGVFTKELTDASAYWKASPLKRRCWPRAFPCGTLSRAAMCPCSKPASPPKRPARLKAPWCAVCAP